MAKWYGNICYAESVETRPGVWEQQETVRQYYGDVKKNVSKWAANSDSTNDDLTINTQISIVADPFANEKFYSMKWIEFMGAKWKITSVDPQPPRLLLTLGSVVWNG